jgi:hypothetical protein
MYGAMVERPQRDHLAFVAAEAPRPDSMCAHYVRRIEPWYGFVVYGVLYYFAAFVCFAIGCIPGFALGAAVGQKGALWVLILGLAGGGAAFVLAWWGFARWVKRKRARALPLVRDGALIEGRVFDRFSGGAGKVAVRVVTDYAVGQIGVKFYRVQLTGEHAMRMLHVPVHAGQASPGTAVTVLFHAECSHALVFDGAGKARVARVS